MKDEFLVITSKNYICPHCAKEILNIQRALWLQMMCEHLQYNNELKIRVTKRNMPHAELPISILKEAFMMEEEYRIEVTNKSIKHDTVIKAVEIKLVKIPAIRK